MDEPQAQQLYLTLIEANRIAFAANLYKVAYHTLAAAAYIAVHLKDSYKLLEIEILIREQHEKLDLCEQDMPTPEGSIGLSLYQSLLQIVRTRLMLLPKHK